DRRTCVMDLSISRSRCRLCRDDGVCSIGGGCSCNRNPREPCCHIIGSRSNGRRYEHLRRRVPIDLYSPRPRCCCCLHPYSCYIRLSRINLDECRGELRCCCTIASELKCAWKCSVQLRCDRCDSPSRRNPCCSYVLGEV